MNLKPPQWLRGIKINLKDVAEVAKVASLIIPLIKKLLPKRKARPMNQKLADALAPHLAELDAMISKLVTPPFTFLEVIDTIKEISDVTAIIAPDATEEELEAHVIEIFDYFDEKYSLIERADAALKWKGILAPIEFFDGPAITWITRGVLLPEAAKRTWNLLHPNH